MTKVIGITGGSLSLIWKEVEYNFPYVEIKVTSEDIKNGRAKSLENALEIVRSKINEKCNTN